MGYIPVRNLFGASAQNITLKLLTCYLHFITLILAKLRVYEFGRQYKVLKFHLHVYCCHIYRL